MTQIPENRARSSEWMQIGARLRSLPTLLHNGNRTIEGFHIVDNDQIPPQTKRIIEIAGHDISDVSKITYLNIGVEDRYDLLTEIADGIEASIGTVEDSSELSY